MDMTIASTPVLPRRRAGRIKRILLGLLGASAASGLVATVAYTYSGSNQWESMGVRKGVAMYSMKSPGSRIKKFKAVWKVKSTMSKFVVFALKEEELTKDYYDMKDIEKQSEQVLWSAWKQAFPSPFRPREFVIKNEFSQDSTTKEVLFKVTAAPDKLPPDACCVRVTLMDNTWRLTPLGQGEIQIEWFVDMDMGGALPFFLQNSEQPKGMYSFARRVQGFLDREKYNNAKVDWIQEPQA